MLMLLILSFIQEAPLDNVKNISDLRNGIIFLDRKNNFYLQISNNEYQKGYPIYQSQNATSHTVRDYGQIESCSSSDVKCVSIGKYNFISIKSPNKEINFKGYLYKSTYRYGVRGWRAICELDNKNSCIKNNNKDSFLFSYEISRNGCIENIVINAKKPILMKRISKYCLRIT